MLWTKTWASEVKYFWKFWLRSMCLFKWITVFLYEKPLAVKVLTSLKNSWILQKSSIILIFSHSEPNWVRASYFESDQRFWDCFLTRWLPTKSILVVVERIYRCQFKANYLKDHRLFAALFFEVLLFTWNFQCSEKNYEPHRSSISQVIDSKTCTYFNA